MHYVQSFFHKRVIIVSFSILLGCSSSDTHRPDLNPPPFELEELEDSKNPVEQEPETSSSEVIIEPQSQHPWAEGYETVHFHPKEQAIVQDDLLKEFRQILNADYSIGIDTLSSEGGIQHDYMKTSLEFTKPGAQIFVGLGSPISKEELHLFECEPTLPRHYIFNNIYIECLLNSSTLMTYGFSANKPVQSIIEFAEDSIQKENLVRQNRSCEFCESGLQHVNVFFYIMNRQKGIRLDQYVRTEKIVIPNASINHTKLGLINE